MVSVRVKKIDESGVSFVINGHRLNLYNKPISRDDFHLSIFSARRDGSSRARKSYSYPSFILNSTFQMKQKIRYINKYNI
jgi:hypothetical protein